jgi:hypothetical protein
MATTLVSHSSGASERSAARRMHEVARLRLLLPFPGVAGERKDCQALWEEIDRVLRGIKATN